MNKRSIRYIVVLLYFSFLLAILLYKAYSASEKGYSISLYDPLEKQNFSDAKLSLSESRVSVSGIAKEGAYLNLSIQNEKEQMYEFPFFQVTSDNGWFHQKVSFPPEFKSGTYTLMVRSLDGSTESKREVSYQNPYDNPPNEVTAYSDAHIAKVAPKQTFGAKLPPLAVSSESQKRVPHIREAATPATATKVVEETKGQKLDLAASNHKSSIGIGETFMNPASSEPPKSQGNSTISKDDSEKKGEIVENLSRQPQREEAGSTSHQNKNLEASVESQLESHNRETGSEEMEAKLSEAEVNPSPIAKIWPEIKKLCDLKKYDEALEKLNDAEKKLIESPSILLYRGIIYYLKGRQLEKTEYRSADKQYEKSVLALQESYRKRSKFSDPDSDIHYLRFYMAVSRYMRLRLAKTLELPDIEQQKYRIESEEAFEKYFLYEKDKSSDPQYNRFWLEASKIYAELKRH